MCSMKKEIKNKKDLNKMEIWIIVIVLIIFLGCLYLIFFSNLGGE